MRRNSKKVKLYEELQVFGTDRRGKEALGAMNPHIPPDLVVERARCSLKAS
jgi:hypothetical protein